MDVPFAGGKFGQYVVKKDGLEGLANFIASTCLFCAPLFALAFRTTHFWASVTLLSLGDLPPPPHTPNNINSISQLL